MSRLITVSVNGKQHQLASGSSLKQLLEQLGVPEDGTAIEIGGELIPRTRFESTYLEEGQRLELVRLVGGG